MTRQISVTYGGLTTRFYTDRIDSLLWHWVTTDNRTGQRIDGAEADPQSVLYMLWFHAQDRDAVIRAEEME